MKKGKRSNTRELISEILTIGLFVIVAYYPDDIFVRIFVALIYCTFNILTLPMKGNNLFVLSIFSCVLFVSVPYFLTYDQISIWISDFLSELKTIEYKSTYIEAIGSFLGSFLAITGALWIENRVKAKQDEDDDAINARIVYYDLEFAFSQMKDILVKSNNKNDIESQKKFKNISKYAEELQNYIVLIDDKWIRTVSSLPEKAFKECERKHLYFLYDHLCKIGRSIEQCTQTGFEDEALLKDAYGKMYNFLLIAPKEYKPDFGNVKLTDETKKLRKLTDSVWETLKKQAKISE